jgi:hypothetical protein
MSQPLTSQTTKRKSMKQFYPLLNQFAYGFRISKSAIRIALFLLMTLLLNESAFATDYYSRANGNWTLNTTWSLTRTGGAATSFPVPGDNVFIQSGHTVTVNSNSAVTNVIIETLGVLTSNNSVTLTVSGDFNNGGTFNANSGSLLVAGILTNTGIFNSSTGTVHFNGSSNQTIPSINYYNLSSTNNNRTLQSSGTIGISGSFSPGTGTYTITGSTVSFRAGANQNIPAFTFENLQTATSGIKTISGAVTVNNVLTIGTNTTLALSTFTLYLSGVGTPLILSGTGAFSSGTSTVIFNAAGNQTIPALTYNNLQTSNAGTKTLEGNVTVGSVLTVGTSTTLNLNTRTLNLTGSGTPLVVAGTFSATTGTSTVNYSNVGSTNVTALNYYNLTLSNGPRVLPNTGTVGIAAIFTPGAGAFTTTGSTIHFNGSIAQTVPTFNYFNLDLTGLGTRTNGGTIGVANVFTPGSVTTLGGTVNFNGNGLQNIPALTYNILQTVTSGVKTLEGNLIIGTSLSVGTGTTLEPGSRSITFNNPPNNSTPFVVNGTFNPSTSTVIYNGGNTLNITPVNYYNLFSSTNTRNVTVNGTIGIANVFTPGTTSFGNVHTIVFNGTTGAQTFAPTNPFTFSKLVINNLNGVNVEKDITINSNLNFISGKIISGNNIVYLPSAGTVTGASSSSYVDGLLRKQIPNNTPSRVFEIGDAIGFAPVTITFTGNTRDNGVLTLRAIANDHPQICASLLDKSASVNRNYFIQNGTGTIVNGYSTSNNSRVNGFTTYSATFNFNSSDIDAGANTNNFIIKRFQTGTPDIWTTPTIGTRTSTSTTFTGLANVSQGFGLFQIAAPEPIYATSAQSASICYNNATNVLMPSSKIGVSYQLRNNADNSLIGSPINGTGAALSFPTGTLLTTTTFNVLATNTTSSCAILMANPTTVIINPRTEKTVTASPAMVCVGNSSKVIIGLSQPNVKYVLRNDADNSSLGDTLTGNSGNLQFNIPVGYLVNTTVFNVWAVDTVSGCTGVLINKVTITIQNFPSPVFDLDQDFCTLGQGKVILATTDSTFNAFLWSNGDPTPSTVIEQSGFYALTVTDANGCRTTKSINIGEEKVINGDFSQGVGVGYTTGYILNQSAGGLQSPGIGYYAINSDANFTHSNFWGKDHTSKTGNFMIVNGKDGISIWQTTVSVLPNTRYFFSAWAMSVNNAAPFAQLQFNINGELAGTSPVLPAGVNNNSNAGWQRFYGTWDSGPISGNITIKIVNLQASSDGNDFGIDDVSFSTLPPISFFGVSVGNGGNNLCLNDTLKLTASLTGGASPINYAWTGPNGFTSSDVNPVIFPGEGGMYYLTATEGRNCSSKDSIFIILSDPIVTGVTQDGKCSGNVRIALSGMVPNSVNNTIYYTVNNGPVRTVSNIVSDALGKASFIDPTLGTSNNTNILRITGIFNGSCTKSFPTPPQVTLDIRSNSQSWVGGVSGKWNDAKNWCPSLPGSGTDVTIPTGVTVYVDNGESVNVRNLTLNGNANLQLRNNARLNFYGDFSGTGKIDARFGIVATRRNNSNQNISGDFFVEKAVSTLVLANTGSTSRVTITGDTLKILSALEFENSVADLTTSDKIVLVSSDTATASVGVIPGAGNVITGNFTVERYLINGRKWRLLSAPTHGQTIRDSWQEGGENMSGYGFKAYDTRSDWEARGFDGRGGGTSIKKYSPLTNTWDAIESTHSSINAERGYLVFVSGDFSANYPNSNATKLRTSGKLFTGDSAIKIPRDTFALIGNPYASRIDLRKLNFTGFDPLLVAQTVYVWDPAATGVYGFGAWRTLVYDGTNYETAEEGVINNFIESGQAFFVKGGVGTNYITFQENDKTTEVGNTISSFTAGASQSIRAVLNLVPATGSPIVLDGVKADFGENYSNSINGFDIKKMGTINESVSWKTNESLLVVDRRAMIVNNDTLHLNNRNYKLQNYQWKITSNNLDFPGRTGFLIDRYKGTVTPLDMAGTTTINFSVQNIAGSYAADRFKIVFNQVVAGPLPVTITTVAATRNTSVNNEVNVNWKVESETNMNNYEVEYSADGSNFTSIATVAPNSNNGSGVYSFLNKKAAVAEHFYRIKANSIGGMIQYSAIVKVAGIKASANSNIIVYPNPVANKQMNVQFNNQAVGNYGLKLINSNGSTVYQTNVTVNSNNLVRTMPLQNSTAAGTYQLIITDASGKTQSQSVIVL